MKVAKKPAGQCPAGFHLVSGQVFITAILYFFFVPCPPVDLEIDSRMSVSAWMF